MPELVEQMYCSQQIVIPPKYPYILKRYCKAAIKTQPYDLLRWSYEYFKALAQKRPPPVKLRLEYPIYSTEGGLTRGCLKVLANQMSGTVEIQLASVRAAWQGFCLDPMELKRILCLCDTYLRRDTILFLNFIAVAAGMLTKSLTHTMILLCETLTKEPDGGSAAIPVQDFLAMYIFLAHMDASKDFKYLNGYREGFGPETISVHEEQEVESAVLSPDESSIDDYWQDMSGDLQKLTLINDHVARSARLSVKLNMPLLGKIERSPSIERAGQIERDNYMRESTGKPVPSEEIELKLKQLSQSRMLSHEMVSKADIEAFKKKKVEEKEVKMVDEIEIHVYDEEDNDVPYEIFGEPKEEEDGDEYQDGDYNAPSGQLSTVHAAKSTVSAMAPKSTAALSAKSTKSSLGGANIVQEEEEPTETQKITFYVNSRYQEREERREDLMETFDEISQFVDRFNSASYDLGMVAGRQMSTTSGEFIVSHIEKEIMAYIDEQIGILPDPDLKKKKAKPEEVAMIRDLLETFLDENMETIVPELEEVEEEELLIPEITLVYAVPGIGPPVDGDIMRDFEEYAWDVCKVQADVFMPRNIRHFMCPPLEKYIEHHYDDDKISKKEEVATGGVITD